MSTRNTLWIALASTLLLAGSACKKSEEGFEQAGKAVESTGERATEKGKEMGRDVKEDLQGAGREAKQEQKELGLEEKGKGDTGEQDFAAQRAGFVAESKEKLADIDRKIDELAAKGDEQSRKTAEDLRAKRDALSNEIDQASTHAAAGWDAFKQRIDAGFENLDKELERAK
ncbi:MAG TPA: hypothetical protein VM734_19495 [Kofleriaceae bacterium]|jgi:hypothetical protein|nr:hypothetical protein [Kofleriaceae bacterium]